MNSLIRIRTIVTILAASALGSFGLSSIAQAVIPPPDGGYPGFNTAEGQNALFSLTTGVGNAAVGWYSLFSNTDGSFNTALGAGTLIFNVGNQNTGEGIGNIAIGTATLLNNTTGSYNTAVGAAALLNSTTGSYNTANGYQALFSNTTGFWNTANGYQALSSNTTGINNTANGLQALYSNTTGSGNTALGYVAGSNITGDGNVCIGSFAVGQAGVNDTTWIKNVHNSVATARQVYVDADNKIGTLSSSRRYKEEIKPMDTASETLFALKPVTFRYRKEIDPSRALSFGLIAEEVAHISPDLITRDEEGQPQTVRYEAINAMLLNEFLKEHGKVDKLEANAAQQQRQIEALTEQLKQQATEIQKVSAQLHFGTSVGPIVLNDQ